MIKLHAQPIKDAYWRDIARQIEVMFFEEIISPVLHIVRRENAQPVRIENAAGEAALKAALRSGRIQYVKGTFSGKLSSSISSALRKLGATFNKRSGIYTLPEAQAPQWLINAAWEYWHRARVAHEMIQDELQRALARISVSTYYVEADKMVGQVEAGWRASAKRLEVKPELGPQQKQDLAFNYSENLDLYIKKWMADDIIALRRDVQDNAEAGYRFDSLIKKIQQRKAVSVNKAKFLARQETGLFMSGYRSLRFQEAGVRLYQWSTSHDSRVRPESGLTPREKMHAGNHRLLDKQIFSYAQKAPAQYMSSGNPCNPGEDYNCRCVDIPLLS